MRAIIALIFWTICLVLPSKVEASAPMVIPPKPNYAPNVTAEMSHEDDIWWDAFETAQSEFTAMFNAIEFKVSKNGRSMVRRPGDKSFRFVKKG